MNLPEGGESWNEKGSIHHRDGRERYKGGILRTEGTARSCSYPDILTQRGNELKPAHSNLIISAIILASDAEAHVRELIF